MLLFGVVVAAVFSIPMDLAADQKRLVAGSLLWLATLFSGIVAMDRSFAAERDENCWEALLLYPLSATAIYLAKLAVNTVALAALQALLVPLFVVLFGVSWTAHPWALLGVAAAGNLGIAAVGTLASAVTAGIRQNTGLLVLLVLPIVIPVVLAAAEATRLLGDPHLGPLWWRWFELLVAFAVVFVTAGAVLIDFIVKD
jgi:heme exporter protein B